MIIGHFFLYIASLCFSMMFSLPKAAPNTRLYPMDVAKYNLAFDTGILFLLLSLVIHMVFIRKILKSSAILRIINIIWVAMNLGMLIYLEETGIFNVPLRYQLSNAVVRNPAWYGFVIFTLLFASILIVKKRRVENKSLNTKNN